MLKTEQFTKQNCRFQNAECFTRQFTDWQLQLLQLETKAFSGVVSDFDFGNLSVFQVSINCKAEFVGTIPTNTVLFLILLNHPDHRALCHFDQAIPIQSNCLLGLNGSQPINFVSTTSGIDFIALQLKQDYFTRIAARLGFQLDQRFPTYPVLSVDEERIDAYRKYLTQILSLLKYPPENLDFPINVNNLQETIVSRLIWMLQTSITAKSPRPLRRADIVQVAREYMDIHIHQPITLAEVSKAINVSRRSLIYGFQDVYGMGPMTYLKYQRLNRVRSELMTQRGSHKTVADIAHICGFWSLGHFARNYRMMFGESPSETLKK